MKTDWNEKEEKVLAELDELKHTGGWHKIRIEVLKKYAAEVSREGMKCHSCGEPLSNECSRCKRLWET